MRSFYFSVTFIATLWWAKLLDVSRCASCHKWVIAVFRSNSSLIFADWDVLQKHCFLSYVIDVSFLVWCWYCKLSYMYTQISALCSQIQGTLEHLFAPSLGSSCSQALGLYRKRQYICCTRTLLLVNCINWSDVSISCINNFHPSFPEVTRLHSPPFLQTQRPLSSYLRYPPDCSTVGVVCCSKVVREDRLSRTGSNFFTTISASERKYFIARLGLDKHGTTQGRICMSREEKREKRKKASWWTRQRCCEFFEKRACPQTWRRDVIASVEMR